MKNKLLLQKLQQSCGFINNTHVVMTSSDHCDTYLNKDLLISDTIAVHELAKLITSLVVDPIEAVAGPPLGGLILAEAIAYELSQSKKPVKLVALEKSQDGLRVKRGQASLLKGKKVLLVDDVVKRGKTLRQSYIAIGAGGGELRQIIVLANWHSIELDDFGVNVVEILDRPGIYKPNDCPMCNKGLKISTLKMKGPRP